ncbi:MAG: tripartite tricarboxylate transporter substrate binding protein [Nitrospirae bacterium]|nr:tripartite tricarboxylate transporter substrate binding protein [Nitrospirota bacterium]
MIIARIIMVFVVALCFPVAAFAEDYPTKPVKIVVPYTEGSATDVIARIVSKKLSGMWGQPMTVENKPGAGGTTGAGAVSKASPDGYTLLVHSSSHAINLALYENLPFTLKDFTDIAPLASQPMVIFVSSTAGVKNVSELIAAAKAKPGELKFGTPGTGSTAHLAAELFKSMVGINAVHVPFTGGPEVIAAMKEGNITYAFLPLAITMKGVREGKLRALGVTSTKRSNELPDVPTIEESGLKGYKMTVWWGIWTPAGVPSTVKDKLVKDVASALASPDLMEQFKKSAFEPMSMTPEKFTGFVQSEREAAARIIKEAGIKPQ